jgi:hypothetical protein
MSLKAHIDHLVIAAASLDDGVRWCENTLGITPGPGGSHALFGTHNRLLRLRSPAHPLTYLEIIAIDPLARPTRDAHLARWFDLDDPVIHEQLREEGPQLLHWVARVHDLEASVAAWHALGIDRGAIVEASRPSAQGELRWKITVRDDGQRLFNGTLPTLIEWGVEHPALAMTGPSLDLLSLGLRHPRADQLKSALTAIGLDAIPVTAGTPALFAELASENGTRLQLTHDESE